MFASRRKARVIGNTGDGDDEAHSQESRTSIKRPNRPKNRARISLRTGNTSMVDDDGEDDRVVIAPRRGIFRRTIERDASGNSLPARAVASTEVADSQEDANGHPIYSQSYLQKLKLSQQSISSSLIKESDRSTVKDIDIAAKFGTSLTRHTKKAQATLIPTDAEIQEKKARRARLAKLEKYQVDSDASAEDSAPGDHLESDEDEFLTQRDRISLRDSRTSAKKDLDTRMIQDDEDIMEGFDDFTNENRRVLLGKNADEEAVSRRRTEMQDLIQAAQDAEEDDDESDREQRNEYDKAQTRKGVEIRHIKGQGKHDDGVRTPSRITSIPSFADAMQKIRDRFNEIDAERQKKLQRLEDLNLEKEEINLREKDIQKLLEETSLKYERLADEAGVGKSKLQLRDIPDNTSSVGNEQEHEIISKPISSELEVT